MKRFAIALLFVLGPSLNGWGQAVPFTYQGLLMFSNQPASGLYDVIAKLRDAPTGGNQVPGTPALSIPDVNVTNGLFTVLLDFRTNAFDGGIRWLELSVRTNGAATFTTLTPAQAITPAPSANFAKSAATAINATAVSNGVYLTGNYTNPPWLASVSADRITGQISDASLSANVALLNRNFPLGTSTQGPTIQGWLISTPYSQYESPSRTLLFKSGGNATSLVDGVTGDGILQLESNLPHSNSVWITHLGSIYVGFTNTWIHTNGFSTPGLPILNSTVSRSLSGPILRLGGNTNLPAALLLNRGGAWLNVGANFVAVDGVTASRTNLSIAGTLFSSTTPLVNNGSSETELLQTIIPACALTNSQDTITFFTSGRFSRAANSKQLRLYYGSSLIADTGAAAQSNLTWTVQGRIVANDDGVTQYVTGSLLWNGTGGYASTNWSTTTSETNGLDAILKITGSSAAVSITNELLQVEIKPAPLHTF